MKHKRRVFHTATIESAKNNAEITATKSFNSGMLKKKKKVQQQWFVKTTHTLKANEKSKQDAFK